MKNGTCDVAIVMAEPVVNPAMAGDGIKSTTDPRRSNPRISEIIPENKAKDEANSSS